MIKYAKLTYFFLYRMISARKAFGLGRILVLGLLIIVPTAPSATGTVTKLKVVDSIGARLFQEPSLEGQPITILPLNTIVEGQSKKGVFWRVIFEKAGVKTTGYLHEIQVVEVKEVDAAASAGSVRPQAELAAEIQIKLVETKEMIEQLKDLAIVTKRLRLLISDVFGLKDRQKQKQLACDIYFWLGQVLASQGDEIAAIKEFRNMYEVDETAATKVTDYVTESSTIRLIEIAKRQYKGVFDGYTLKVETDPKEAVIKIDGEVKGRSPELFILQVPRVTLEIEKDGYKPIKEIVSLTSPSTFKSYTLESFGRTIRVSSNPPGANVILDGRDSGKVTDCEIPLVRYGQHTLKVKKEHYADFEESFTVSDGNDPLSKSVLLTVKDYVPVRSWGGPDKKIYITPKALALDKGGNFYVADESGIPLRKFNSDGILQTSWGSMGQQFKRLKIPAGIAIDSQGNFYVTDKRNSCVAKFDKNGQFRKEWGKSGAKEGILNYPLGIAVDRNNDIFVVDAGNSRIVKYSSEGEMKKYWGKAGSGQEQFTQPTAVAVSKNNEVIVIDLGRIQKFTADGVFIGSFGKLGSGEVEFSRAFGVCLDGDDNIYVADTGNNRVQKFAPDGGFICQWGGPGSGADQFSSPVGVAVNEKGSVFVLEKYNVRVQEFRILSK